MNAKQAKIVRRIAGYDNQSKTPGRLGFPGIAGFYNIPVFETQLRQVFKKEYVLDVETGLPAWTDVCYTVRRNLPGVNRYIGGRVGWQNAGIQVIVPAETVLKTAVNEAGEIEGKEVTTPAHFKLTPVPRTKPARLDQQDPKQLYRRAKKFVQQFGYRAFITDLLRAANDGTETAYGARTTAG